MKFIKLLILSSVILSSVFAKNNQCTMRLKLENGESVVINSEDFKQKEKFANEYRDEIERQFRQSVAGFPFPSVNMDVNFMTRVNHLMNIKSTLKSIELEQFEQGTNYPLYSYTKIADGWYRLSKDLESLINDWSDIAMDCYLFLTHKNVQLNDITPEQSKKMSYPRDYPKPCIKLCVSMSLPKVGKAYQEKLNKFYLPELREKLASLIKIKYQEPPKEQSYLDEKNKIKKDYQSLRAEYIEKSKRFHELKDKKEHNEYFVKNKKKLSKVDKHWARKSKKILKKEVYPFYEQAQKEYEDIKKRYDPINKEYTRLGYRIDTIEDIKKGKVDKEIEAVRGIIYRLSGPQPDRV
ncbi:hypothetical protein N9N67_03995 [Bacteriovoracaceae bacterium]|nr:hypothetical protein [Bacteriovoracaceae bacterium]